MCASVSSSISGCRMSRGLPQAWQRFASLRGWRQGSRGKSPEPDLEAAVLGSWLGGWRTKVEHSADYAITFQTHKPVPAAGDETA
jgi:ribosome modulation factor